MMNSVELGAIKRNEITQDGYDGTGIYGVEFEGRTATVHAKDRFAALAAAAKTFGTLWTNAEYHQKVTVYCIRKDRSGKNGKN